MKFKVWDIIRKKFIDKNDNNMGLSTYFVLGGDGSLIKYEYGDCCPHSFFNVDMNDYKIMFSTGLYDKNRIEIFEGDIVNIMHLPIRFIDEPVFIQTLEVESFLNFLIQIGKFFDGLQYEELLEVIGNVYENPELLEKL
jgi:uncharacterized phage protein (TIGR01671 family)